MCRLYGFRASEATKVECTLIHAQNALLIQSRGDLRGVSHADGWGIACYADAGLEVERQHTAAHADALFSATAERIYAQTVVAHIRRATVGKASLFNTHPFQYGIWVFAHNGTLPPFDELRGELVTETHPLLQQHRHGTTDSEQAFYWLLTRMAKTGIDLAAPVDDVDTMVSVFARSVAELAERCEKRRPEREAKLNFLMTDGRMLVASCWGNTLHWVKREGVHDCEICGISHVLHRPRQDYRAVVIASEPISNEAWEPLRQGQVVAVSGNLDCGIHSI